MMILQIVDLAFISAALGVVVWSIVSVWRSEKRLRRQMVELEQSRERVQALLCTLIRLMKMVHQEETAVGGESIDSTIKSN